MNDIKVIALTGGAGAGKSFISEILKTEFKLFVIDSDSVTKSLMEPGGAIYDGYIALLGPVILNADYTINRAKVAEIVFNDDALLKAINEIAHPATIDSIKEQIKSLKEAGEKVVFVESAIAYSSGYSDFCNEFWYVDCSEETRRKRLKLARNYSDEKIDAIISNQRANERSQIDADVIIENEWNDTRESLTKKIAFHLPK